MSIKYKNRKGIFNIGDGSVSTINKNIFKLNFNAGLLIGFVSGILSSLIAGIIIEVFKNGKVSEFLKLF